MRKLLEENLKRFEELEQLLIDPEVLANPARLAAIARERGSLAKVGPPLREEKDVRFFIECMAEVNKLIDNLVILIVGDGLMKNELMQICNRNGLRKNTIFTGYIRDIRDYVYAMDIACLTPKKTLCSVCS